MDLLRVIIVVAFGLLLTRSSSVNGQGGVDDISPPGSLPPGVREPGFDEDPQAPLIGYPPPLGDTYGADSSPPPPGLQAYIVRPSSTSPNPPTHVTDSSVPGYGAPAPTSSTTPTTSTIRSSQALSTSSPASQQSTSTTILIPPSGLPKGISPPGDSSSATSSTPQSGSSTISRPSNIDAPSGLPPGVSEPADNNGEYGGPIPTASVPPGTPPQSIIIPRNRAVLISLRKEKESPAGKDFIETSTSKATTGGLDRSFSALSRILPLITINVPLGLPPGISAPSANIGDGPVSTTVVNGAYDLVSSSASSSIASSSTITSTTESSTGSKVTTTPTSTRTTTSTTDSSGPTLPPASPPPPPEPDIVPGYGEQLSSTPSSSSSSSSSSSTTTDLTSSTSSSTSVSSSTSQGSTISVGAPSNLPPGEGSSPSSSEGPDILTPPGGYGPESTESPDSSSVFPPGVLPPAISPPGDDRLALPDSKEEVLQFASQRRLIPAGLSGRSSADGKSRSISTTSAPDGPLLTTPKRPGSPSSHDSSSDLSTRKPIKKTSTNSSRSQNLQEPTVKKTNKLVAPGVPTRGKFAPEERGSSSTNLNSKKTNGTRSSTSSKLTTITNITPPHGRTLLEIQSLPSATRIPPTLPPALPLIAARRSDSTVAVPSPRAAAVDSKSLNQPVVQIARASAGGAQPTPPPVSPTSSAVHLSDAKPVLSVPNSDLRLSSNSISAPGTLPQGVSPPAGNGGQVPGSYNGPAPATPPAPYNPQPPAPAPGPSYPGNPGPGPSPPGSLPAGVSPPSIQSYSSGPIGPYAPRPRPSGYDSPSPTDPHSYGPSINPNCVDVHPKCDYFVANGKCRNPQFSAFVRQVCPRSCNACEVHTYGSHSSGSYGSAGGYGTGTGCGSGGCGGGKPGLGPGDYYFGPPTLPLGPPIGPPGCCGGSGTGGGSYGPSGGGSYAPGNTGGSYGSPQPPATYGGDGTGGCGSGGCAPSDQSSYGNQGATGGGCGSGGCGGDLGPAPPASGYGEGSPGCGAGGCGPVAPSYQPSPPSGSYGGGPSPGGCGSGGCAPAPGPASYGGPPSGTGGYRSDSVLPSSPDWSKWSTWSFPCKNGLQHRSRTCISNGKTVRAVDCDGKAYETRPCLASDPVNVPTAGGNGTEVPASPKPIEPKRRLRKRYVFNVKK